MAESGNNSKIYVVSGGSTYGVIAGNISASLTVNGVIIDTSDKDSGWATNIAGEKSWSVSGSFRLKRADTVQQALNVGDLVSVFIGELSGASPLWGHSGTARIESLSYSYEKDDVANLDISFTGSSTLTKIANNTTAAPTTTGA